MKEEKELDIQYYMQNWSTEILRSKYKELLKDTPELIEESPYRFEQAAYEQAMEDYVLNKKYFYVKRTAQNE